MLIFLSMLESDEERRLFTDLYNQYGNMMLHVAKRYFPKDMYAAEDVVQNAWIRVVDHFQKIQAVPSKKRGAYLVVIVRNEAITALRKQKPELQFDENFVEGYIDLENDNTRSIIDTIRAMPDIYRTVLEMRFVEERRFCNYNRCRKYGGHRNWRQRMPWTSIHFCRSRAKQLYNMV